MDELLLTILEEIDCSAKPETIHEFFQHFCHSFILQHLIIHQYLLEISANGERILSQVKESGKKKSD